MNSSVLLPPGHFCGFSREVFHSENSSFTLHTPTNTDIAKCTFIVILTLCIVSLNLLMIAVLNSRNHYRYLRQRPRYFMTSLAVTDLAMGTLVTPFCIYPALFHCWPFGRFFCAVESLFISALFHQSSLSLMFVAIDRYVSIIYPFRYNTIITRKVCLCMIAASWLTSFTVYSAMIYPHAKYFFDPVGIMTCEPFYANKEIIILAVTLFYFPPLLVIIFCYVSIFFVAKKQLQVGRLLALTVSACSEWSTNSKVVSKERIKNFRTSLNLAAITLGFVIAVTPWTLTELYSSCFEKEIPKSILFAVTWIAVSNSFWNPIIYGVMSSSFRTVAAEVLRKVLIFNRQDHTHRLPSRLSQLTLDIVL